MHLLVKDTIAVQYQKEHVVKPKKFWELAIVRRVDVNHSDSFFSLKCNIGLYFLLVMVRRRDRSSLLLYVSS